MAPFFLLLDFSVWNENYTSKLDTSNQATSRHGISLRSTGKDAISICLIHTLKNTTPEMWYSPPKEAKSGSFNHHILVILVLGQGGAGWTYKEKRWLKEWFAFWGGWFGMDTSNPRKAEVHSIFHRVTHRSSTWSQVHTKQGKWCSVAMQNHRHSTTCCHKHTKKDQVRKTLFQKVVELKLPKKTGGCFSNPKKNFQAHPSVLWMVFSRNVEPPK